MCVYIYILARVTKQPLYKVDSITVYIVRYIHTYNNYNAWNL